MKAIVLVDFSTGNTNACIDCLNTCEYQDKGKDAPLNRVPYHHTRYAVFSSGSKSCSIVDNLIDYT